MTDLAVGVARDLVHVRVEVGPEAPLEAIQGILYTIDLAHRVAADSIALFLEETTVIEVENPLANTEILRMATAWSAVGQPPLRVRRLDYRNPLNVTVDVGHLASVSVLLLVVIRDWAKKRRNAAPELQITETRASVHKALGDEIRQRLVDGEELRVLRPYIRMALSVDDAGMLIQLADEFEIEGAGNGLATLDADVVSDDEIEG